MLTVRIPHVQPGWEQWFLLASDVHWDNPMCRRDLFHKHLRQAQERDAGWTVVGDLFCAMQGKYDPRSSKQDLRPEHQVPNYLDALVDTAVADLVPYRDNCLAITRGNHEESIQKRHETDLIHRLSQQLGVNEGGYAGYIRFMFEHPTKGNRTSRNLFYHHGYGGGGPVTKGTIQTNRRAVYLPDADIVVGGHIHEQWLMVITQSRLSASGRMYQDYQYHVCTSTYKDEFVLKNGFHIERGRPPKPLGGWWMRFFYDTDRRGNVGIDFSLAQ